MDILRSKYGIKIGSSTGYSKEIMVKLRVKKENHLSMTLSTYLIINYFYYSQLRLRRVTRLIAT